MMKTLISVLMIFTFVGCAVFQPENEPRPYERFGRNRYSTPDISLGMPTRIVKNVWGAPQDIEIAGNQESGNQRWIYSDGLSSQWNLGKKRIVYFERGRVVGWETLEE